MSVLTHHFSGRSTRAARRVSVARVKRALVIAVMVGCGGGHHAADAAIDTPPASDLVTVTLIDPTLVQATPLAGATVVFIDDNGTQSVTTDANGKAQAAVLAGGSVSSVRFTGGTAFVTSVLAVQPGDSIALGVPLQDTASAGSVNASFDTTTPSPAGYTISTACGITQGTTSPINVPLTNDCVHGGLELVLEGSPGGVPAFAIASGIAFISGETVAIPGYTAEPTFTSMLTDIPTLAYAEMSRTSDYATSTAPVLGGATATVSFPGVVGSAAYFHGEFGATGGSTQSIYFQAAPTTPQYNLDVGNTLLPWIAAPTVDPGTGAITATTTTTGTSGDAPDFAIASLSFLAGGSTSVEWTVYGPDPTMLMLPALPADLAVTGGTLTSGSIALVELDSLASYDAVRASPDTVLGTLTTATGRSRVSLSPPPPI